MDDYWRSNVPAFGSWDCAVDNFPFTEYFDSAIQPGILHYSHSEVERDLYVAGDLYENDVVTPAMIVVSRKREKTGYPHVEEAEKEAWVVGDVKEPPSPVSTLPRKFPKPVDEDLYQISPVLRRAKSNRKRGWSFFSNCLPPGCAS